MSDTVTQQVLVEFLGSVSATFEKALKSAISDIKALATAQKQANDAMSSGTKMANAQAASKGKLGTEVTKVTENYKRWTKVMKELSADYSEQGAGLRSVYSAMKYYAAGVMKGNESVGVARKQTRDYMTSLMATNSVLMAADKSYGNWAKTVKFKTLIDAQQAGQIELTRNGIQLMNAEAYKAIGLTKDQAKVLEAAGMSQDMYAKKLREAQIIGGDYLKSFKTLGGTLGTSNKEVASWSQALDQADKSLNALRTRAKNSKEDIGSVAVGVGRAAVAVQILQGNLSASGGSFKIFNDEGRKALGVTVDQASKLNLLARSYGEYGATLQRMRTSHDANLKSFVELTKIYGKSDSSVKMINKALAETDKILSARVVVQQNKLNAAVSAGTMTQSQANAALTAYKAGLDQVGLATEIVNEKMAKAASTLRNYNSDVIKASKYGPQYRQALEAGIEKYTVGTADYKSYVSNLNLVEQAINKMGVAMNKAGKNGDGFVQFADRAKLATSLMHGKLEAFYGMLGNSHQHLMNASEKTSAWSLALDKLGTSMLNVAKYAASAFAFYGAVSVISELTKQILNYDQSLKDLQAITTATDHQVVLFGETIKNVARDTKFSATEVANGMKNLGQAGFSAAETMVVIGDAATLATGTLSDMEMVVDLMTSTIRAYHLEASESGRLTDLFANSVNRSKLTIDKLRVAMNYMGSVAEKANLTVDDSVTLMGMLANAGVRASTIGTSLRQVVEGLVSPNKALKDAIESAGYTTEQFIVSAANPLEDVIRRLQKVVPDAAAAFDLFGIRGAPAISAITSHGVEGFLKMREAMQEAGSASKMAEIQMEGLANKAKNMKDRFELLGIALGDAGLKYLFEGLIEVGRGFASVLEGVISSALGKAVIAVGSLGLAISALNLGIKMFMGTSFVASLQASYTAAVTAAGGVGLLTGAIAALRNISMFLVTTPLGWAALAAAAVATAVAFSNATKEQQNFLNKAEKTKTVLDQEIKLNDKKKNAANALVQTLKDTTKTETQRAVALERLASLGVDVESAIRDEQGAIKNLDEAIKNALPATEKYVQELNALSERKRADKMAADVEAFLKAEQAFSDALKNKSDLEKNTIDVYINYSASGGDPSSVFEEAEQNVVEFGNQVDATGQKVEEVIGFWSNLNKETYITMLQSAKMSRESAEHAAKNFDALDSHFLKLWVNQLRNLKDFSAEAMAAFDELIRRLDQASEAYKNSPETQLRAILQESQLGMKELQKNIPDLKVVGEVKDKAFFENYLAAVKQTSGKAEEITNSAIEKIRKVEGASTEVITQEIDAQNAARENFNKKSVEDTEKAVQEIGKFYSLETEAHKIELDNRINALKISQAQRIGDEFETSNAILAIQKQQVQAEIDLKQRTLSLMKSTGSTDIQAQMALQNEINSLTASMAQMRVEEIKNIEDKAAQERERAERARAFDHNMELLQLDREYWDEKEMLAVKKSAASLAYLDKEMKLVNDQIAKKRKLNQDTYEEEMRYKDLLMQKTEEQTQAFIAQKELVKSQIEEEIKKLEWMQKTFEAGTKQAELSGNITALYDQSIAALEVQIQIAEQRRSIAESTEEEMYYTQEILNLQTEIANLKAERDMDIGALMIQGLRQFNIDQYKSLVDMYKNVIPNALEATGNAFGDMVVDLAHGESSWSNIWDKARQTLSEAVDSMLADMAKLWAQRFILSMIGGFTGVFSGGSYVAGAAASGATGAMAGSGSFLHGSYQFADGGEIPGTSPNSRADNIPIWATAGEFMQPVHAVEYYGKGIMEALRTRSIPKEVISRYGKNSSKSGGNKFADGGSIDPQASSGSANRDQSLHIVNILDPGMFDQYMSSTSGQKALMNVISRNPQVIRNIVRN